MRTEQLLLDRALGNASAESHIAWAVERLEEGADSPNLRILAGLHPDFDRDEVERYFSLTCAELGIAAPGIDADSRAAARVVQSLYQEGALSAVQVVRRMAELFRRDYSDPLLRPWSNLDEDLDMQGSPYGGIFFSSEELKDLSVLVDQEWEVFNLTLAAPGAPDLYNWVLCQKCGSEGPPQFKRRSFFWRVRTRLSGGAPNVHWAHCTNCGSHDVYSVGYHPAFRLRCLQARNDPGSCIEAVM